MVFGIILAGGVGSRMNHAAMPKQFLPLGDKPILMHPVARFLDCAQLDEVYIGVHKDWMDHTRELLNTHFPDACIHTVCGGGDRNDTLFAVIEEIETRYGTKDEHILVTHDAVRPFVTARILEDNVAAAKQYGAVNTVIPAVDTILVSGDGNVIDSVPERRTMYQAQTPQSFQLKLLTSLYRSLSDKQKAGLTDTASVCVACGHPVHLVRGEQTNLKITTPEDYRIAEAIVAMN